MVIAIGLKSEDVDIVVEGDGCEEEDDKGELFVDDSELPSLYTELLLK